MAKALILTWDGFQDQEVIYPYYRLQEAGFQVDIMGPDKYEVVGLFGTKFPCTRLSDYGNDYDFLCLPGGVKALEKIRQEKRAINLIKNWPNNKPIASICHGAQLLISAGLVKNKVISGYYSIEDDIVNAGGVYSRSPVISGNIASGAHYKDMPTWMRYSLELYDELQRRSSS